MEDVSKTYMFILVLCVIIETAGNDSLSIEHRIEDPTADTQTHKQRTKDT